MLVMGVGFGYWSHTHLQHIVLLSASGEISAVPRTVHASVYTALADSIINRALALLVGDGAWLQTMPDFTTPAAILLTISILARSNVIMITHALPLVCNGSASSRAHVLPRF